MQALLPNKSLQATVDRVVSIGYFAVAQLTLLDALRRHMLNHPGAAALRQVLGACLRRDHRLTVPLVKHLRVLRFGKLDIVLVHEVLDL